VTGESKVTVKNAVTSENVTFEADGCTLAGTFTEVARPLAAALLIAGSGKTDRDSDVRLPGGLMLRGGITRGGASAAAGVSTLRYDKRGVGASGGDYFSTGMSQRLADAQAALAWLAARCDGLSLIVLGHSEGTYYAAQLASGNGSVAGAVLLSGSVRPGAEVLTWQTEQLADRIPASAKLILRLMRTDVVRSQRKNLAKIMSASADVIRVQGTRVNAKWVRDFVRYDPAPALASVTVPVLAVTGEHDLQVPPADVEAIGRLVRGPFEGHVVRDLSHMLRPDPDSVGPRGYRRQARQPVSPEVLTIISAWVRRNWGEA
jgi:uncharacterized protein